MWTSCAQLAELAEPHHQEGGGAYHVLVLPVPTRGTCMATAELAGLGSGIIGQEDFTWSSAGQHGGQPALLPLQGR